MSVEQNVANLLKLVEEQNKSISHLIEIGEKQAAIISHLESKI